MSQDRAHGIEGMAEAGRVGYRTFTEASIAVQEQNVRAALGLLAFQVGAMQAFAGSLDGRAGKEDLPVDGYDRLDVDGLGRELEGLCIGDVERLKAYEKRTRNRRAMLERLDRALV